MLRLRGKIPRDTKWDVVVDLFFYREPDDAEKEEQAAKEAVAAVKPDVPVHEEPDRDWNPPDTQDWTADPVAAPLGGVAPPYTTTTNDDWAADMPEQFSAAPTGPTNWAPANDW